MPTLTAGEVVKRIKSTLGVPWRDTSYRDTYKFGGPRDRSRARVDRTRRRRDRCVRSGWTGCDRRGQAPIAAAHNDAHRADGSRDAAAPGRGRDTGRAAAFWRADDRIGGAGRRPDRIAERRRQDLTFPPTTGGRDGDAATSATFHNDGSCPRTVRRWRGDHRVASSRLSPSHVTVRGAERFGTPHLAARPRLQQGRAEPV